MAFWQQLGRSSSKWFPRPDFVRSIVSAATSVGVAAGLLIRHVDSHGHLSELRAVAGFTHDSHRIRICCAMCGKTAIRSLYVKHVLAVLMPDDVAECSRG